MVELFSRETMSGEFVLAFIFHGYAPIVLKLDYFIAVLEPVLDKFRVHILEGKDHLAVK